MININADADLVLVDMNKNYKLANENLFTRPKITIFDGRKLTGRIEKTLVRGKLIFDNGAIISKQGTGNFLKSINSL
jgi:dihydroorotase-like cyclic amidohydrolase